MLSSRILLAVALGAVLLAPSASGAEDNQAIVRRYIAEAVNKGNMAVVDELVAPTYVGHSTVGPEVKGSEALKQRLTMIRTAFPDLQVTVDDIVADGNKVATRTTLRGTQKGEYLGIAPTGKQVTATAIGITHLENGKIKEGWLNSDLLQQLNPGPKTK